MNVPQHIQQLYAQARCLYTKAEVESALDSMAYHMNAKLNDANPIMLCVMVGGVVPLGTLMPRLQFPLTIDYIHATRYRLSTTGGDLAWQVEPVSELAGRNVVVVDDILDGGITLRAIVDYCHHHNANSIYTAVLVDKSEARVEGGWPKADFTGLNVGDYFVFGYGMDYQKYLRNAPGIFAVPESLQD
jgi:hypoxanthine phosphoribosyltransferase